MPIDYSKWDHIELSDDSDIEVHPNVDKRSFIRWKQRDIHEKRAQRNVEIKTMLVQLTMYRKLNARVDLLVSSMGAEIMDNAKVMLVLKEKFDPNERFDYDKLKEEQGNDLRKGLRDLTFNQDEIDASPPYNEMVEDLLRQIKDEHPEIAADSTGDKMKAELKSHRKRIDEVLSQQSIKLDQLLHEKAQLISSDDYHTGFDRSFMNKDDEEAEKSKTQGAPQVAATPAESKSAPTSETTPPIAATSPAATGSTTKDKEGASAPAQAESKSAVAKSSVPTALTSTSSKTYEPKVILDDLILLPETQEFGDIPATNLRQSAEFMIRHTNICTEQQKDGLIMSAFDVQLAGQSADVRRIVNQSLLLQYVAQLSGNRPIPDKNATIKAVKMFCSKLSEPGPARDGFYADVDNTVNHIVTRCKVIEQEQLEREADDGEQLIQLRALDEGTELSVNLPPQGTPEYEIFKTKLPESFQEAVASNSLDRVNEEFAKLKVEDAEKILEVFNECGVIGISGVLENEGEFNQLKEQHQMEEAKEERATKQAHEYNTVDEVD
ncbi:hsp90 co-chaperone Cdc37 [Diutina catenulata]